MTYNDVPLSHWAGYAAALIEIALDHATVLRLAPSLSSTVQPWPFAAALAILTAANPDSQRLTDVENRQRNRRLAAALARGGIASVPAVGYSADRQWVERSVAVDIAHLPAILTLAQAFGQAAIFVCEPTVTRVIARTGEEVFQRPTLAETVASERSVLRAASAE
jgi:hypothetical protein